MRYKSVGYCLFVLLFLLFLGCSTAPKEMMSSPLTKPLTSEKKDFALPKEPLIFDRCPDTLIQTIGQSASDQTAKIAKKVAKADAKSKLVAKKDGAVIYREEELIKVCSQKDNSEACIKEYKDIIESYTSGSVCAKTIESTFIPNGRYDKSGEPLGKMIVCEKRIRCYE